MLRPPTGLTLLLVQRKPILKCNLPELQDNFLAMFRLAFISIITLRVIFCPLLCIGCDDGVRAFQTVETHTCRCSDEDREPCSGEEVPTPFDCPSDCPCPCDTGCVCQVTPELNNRTVAADFALAVDFLPVCFDSVDFSQGFAPRGDEISYRLDLESGRDIRVAHASFLL